jgi:iron-sulfur cluster assembly protein
LLELTKTTIQTVNTLSKATGTRGLRVFRHRSGSEILFGALVDRPTAGDEVIEEDGAVVFVDAATASAFADKRLDARVAEGRVHLRLLEQS